MAIRRGEVNLGGRGARAVVQVREFADHRVRFINARFRFGGARFGAAAQPFNFGVYEIFERFLPLALRVEVLFLRFQEVAVISINAEKAVFVGAIKLDHVIGDIFEEVAVVADDYAGEGSVLQQRFEPFDSGEIEMIGGLVQKQNIRLLDESFGNRQAFFPAAGERGGGDFKILKSCAAEGFGGAKREIGFGHAGFFQRGFDHRVSSFSGGKFGNLRNATQPGAFANRDVSAVWRDARRGEFREAWICRNHWGRSGRCDRLPTP